MSNITSNYNESLNELFSQQTKAIKLGKRLDTLQAMKPASVPIFRIRNQPKNQQYEEIKYQQGFDILLYTISGGSVQVKKDINLRNCINNVNNREAKFANKNIKQLIENQLLIMSLQKIVESNPPELNDSTFQVISLMQNVLSL